MPSGLSELQKQILNILEDHGGYTNRGFIRHKIWPSLYPHTFKTWNILHSPIPKDLYRKETLQLLFIKASKDLN